ncbi:MAG: ABC transporter permease [Thermoplasmata archaeon]
MQSRAILLRKLINLIILLWAVWTLNFLLFHMLPGDPAMALVGQRIPKEMVDELKHSFGLDQPLWRQYFTSLFSAMKGNLGYSWFYDKPVADVVLYRLWYTLLLVGVGTLFTVVIGVYLGIAAGSRRGEALDVAIVGSSLAFYAMPAFWLGMILLMVLAADLQLFPLSGFRRIGAIDQTLSETIVDVLWHMVLPVATFVLVSMSEFVLMMRNALVDVLTEDYIVTARAKGVAPRLIVREHAVPNALLPTIATTAMFIGWMVTGAIMIEVVFSWPGIGRLTWDALSVRDYPVLQGIFLVVTLAMLIANFVADIVYTYIDPRVRI